MKKIIFLLKNSIFILLIFSGLIYGQESNDNYKNRYDILFRDPGLFVKLLYESGDVTKFCSPPSTDTYDIFESLLTDIFEQLWYMESGQIEGLQLSPNDINNLKICEKN